MNFCQITKQKKIATGVGRNVGNILFIQDTRRLIVGDKSVGSGYITEKSNHI